MNPLAFLSTVAFAFYVDSAVRTIALDPKSSLNRVASAAYTLLAIWAIEATLSYSVTNPVHSRLLYLGFSFSWNFFFGLALHFCLLASGRRLPRGALPFVLLYAPGLFFTFYTNLYLLEGFVFRGGYWMAVVKSGWPFWLFVGYYFGFLILGGLALALSLRRAVSKSIKRRNSLLLAGLAIPAILGFITDSVAMSLGMEVPNLGIIWIGLWALSVRIAVTRYGLFAPFPRHAARQIVDSMQEAFYYLDEEGRVVWANRSAGEAAGVESADRLRGLFLEDAAKLSGDDRIAARWVVEGRASEPVYLRRFGSRGQPAEIEGKLLQLEQPPLAGAIATVRDLAEAERRWRAEELLADAGRVFEAFLANSLDGIVITDSLGLIESWSESLERFTGILAKEAKGRPLGAVMGDLVPERAEATRVAAAFASHISEIVAGLCSDSPSNMAEFMIRDARGTERWLQSAAFAIPQSGGTSLAAILRDVSDQRRASLAALEEAKRTERAHRMESVGTLAAGLAHDFNNILAGVTGTVSLMRLRYTDGDVPTNAEILEGLEVIESSASKAAAIARRLLDFSRARHGKAAPVALAVAIENAIGLSKGGLGHTVHLVAGELPRAAYAMAEHADIERIVVNLVLNASEAMTVMRPSEQAKGGTVWIELRAAEPAEALAAKRSEKAFEGYWILSVRDEGVGIPRELLSKVFDPFFTTKGSGSSSGLGLYIVDAIARRTGGFAEIRSESGIGTEVRVFLPMAKPT